MHHTNGPIQHLGDIEWDLERPFQGGVWETVLLPDPKEPDCIQKISLPYLHHQDNPCWALAWGLGHTLPTVHSGGRNELDRHPFSWATFLQIHPPISRAHAHVVGYCPPGVQALCTQQYLHLPTELLLATALIVFAGTSHSGDLISSIQAWCGNSVLDYTFAVTSHT